MHARGGHRETYRPIATVAGAAVAPGDALAVAHRYRELGISDLYIADLDAIARQGSHDRLLAQLAELQMPLWIDAGVAAPPDVASVRASGTTRVIVALETLAGLDGLRALRAHIEEHALVFSLDLREGRPLTNVPALAALSPRELAEAAVEAGADAVILLDLARVGMRSGPDVALTTTVRRAVPDTLLLAGGGVSGPDDLKILADSGCDGVLVATALLDGRLNADHILEARLHHNPHHTNPTW